mmetsp:Transcript_1635/g.6806  ORF Transcript_1635/g.6806 Transcript_1635/m.6806 type:complete len:225 (-) Transcript_1635:375-1049(-)
MSHPPPASSSSSSSSSSPSSSSSSTTAATLFTAFSASSSIHPSPLSLTHDVSKSHPPRLSASACAAYAAIDRSDSIRRVTDPDAPAGGGAGAGEGSPLPTPCPASLPPGLCSTLTSNVSRDASPAHRSCSRIAWRHAAHALDSAASAASAPSSAFASERMHARRVAHSREDGASSDARSALARAHRRNIRRWCGRSPRPCVGPKPRCLMKNLRGFSCASHAESE